MNRKTVFIAATAAVALALSACAADTQDSGAPARVTDAAAGATQAHVDEAHDDADTMFAQMMIVHHEGAVEMADLAVQKTDSEELRTLAEGISAAQGPEIEQMQSWLQAWGEETAPHGGMHGMDHGGMEMDGMSQEQVMAELPTLSGAAFDRRFLELMIAHHRGAVEMAQAELEDGSNPQALELAQKIIDDQQREITQMEQMLESP